MANEEQLAILRQGVSAWNGWRKEHPQEMIDLSEVGLEGADLSGADLSWAHLSGALLSTTRDKSRAARLVPWLADCLTSPSASTSGRLWS